MNVSITAAAWVIVVVMSSDGSYVSCLCAVYLNMSHTHHIKNGTESIWT